MLGDQVGDKSISGRTTDALADAVDKPRGEHDAIRAREWEKRFSECCDAIPYQRQGLALAEPVAEHARENLGYQSGCFRNPLEYADCRRASAEHRHQKDRQQAVDHLGGDVHEHADETERPYAARDCVNAYRRLCILSGLAHDLPLSSILLTSGRNIDSIWSDELRIRHLSSQFD